jgi:ADP-ribose pyrophosphatase YjhB (NUDIX family)
VCGSCGSIHYVNPKIVAGTIPVRDGRVWLLRRAIEPRLGTWTFPSGFMEMGETVEDAAIRETLEELGMQISLGRLLNAYSLPSMTTVHLIYLAAALSDPVGGSETLEYKLFHPEEIPWEELSFWSTHQALREWIETLRA